MPVSVSQPSKISVSSSSGSVNVSLSSGSSEIKLVTNSSVSNNVSVSGSSVGSLSITDSSNGNFSLSGSGSSNNVSITNGGSNNISLENSLLAGPPGPTGPQGPAGPAGSSQPLQAAITISNDDDAFAHMSSPIASGTTIEAVLREMLEKYNRTTITLNSLSVQKQNTDGSYAAAANVSSSENIEVGRGIKILSFNISIGDNTQVTDESVKFLRGATEIETGFRDTDGDKTLSSSEDQDPTSETTLSYKATAVDDGGSGLPDQTISSSSITFSYRFLIRVGASTTSSISNDTEAAALWTGMTTAYSQLRGESDFNVTANASMDASNNFTWIAYPASFGNLNKIDLAGVDVLSDFQSPVDYNITNDYGTQISYRFYRSTYSDAFKEGQILTIDF